MSAAPLKEGDVCVVVDSPCMHSGDRGLIGSECVVTRVPTDDLAKLVVFLSGGPQHQPAQVRFADGSKVVLCGTCLRRKQPPAEKGSWNLIEKITGWVPKPTLMPEPA